MNTLTLGSLFDGSGTAPLAATMCGITPVWASEIEPYPIRVTTARFPDMKHLGNITDINGADVTPVDIICGGSPCQDLSVAGKQAGLHDGERSHLFFEMTRIIKEMRGATNGRYPRYIVWENVPGAFSSNKGRDFLAVLQAFAEIADPDIHVPEPKQKACRFAWKLAGYVGGDGWSLAWRTVDAQYWGVPQRRRRIYLVVDLGGECADEILFERTGVSGNSEPCGTAREETAGDAGRSVEGKNCDGCLNPWDSVCAVYDTTQITSPQNGSRPQPGDPCHPLAARQHPPLMVSYSPVGNHCGVCAETQTLATLETKYHYGSGSDAAMVVYDARGNGDGETVPCLTGDHQNRVTDYTAVCVGNSQVQNLSMSEQSNTLDCMHDQQAVLINATHPRKYIIRRLTPLECCRLQGFPDWWEDGAEGSDSARYKMWGNGMALPNMLHVMKGIVRVQEDESLWVR